MIWVILTAEGSARSGNCDSNVEPATAGSMVVAAAASCCVANWSASSPRRAFSRARKSSVEGSTLESLISV